ncbi:MAG TPA: pyridoxamine 5'-phosphate oxidase family protein [Smithellaceae bacterium]|mgnify:CR=1 FL=1|nr:pyridoxamine 5'-phosphate oxidase family protein [Smithellaceae bacterium]
MRRDIREMMETNRICALATAAQSGPHCSLMSYAVSEDGTELYMATDKNTKKYRNLEANPSVSLLIDSREERARHRGAPTRALTVTGTIRRDLDEPGKKEIREALCRRHPDLKDFLADPSVEVIVVKIKSLQLLDGIRDSYFEEV